MCTKPLFRITDLAYTGESTKKKVFFAPTKNELDIKKMYPSKRYIKEVIPCGQCKECMIKKSKEWAFRCVKEAKQYEKNIMITCTYNDEHLPKFGINKDTGEIIETNETLSIEDHQKFMKRLRKKTKQKIRFFMCGEYGEKKKRPHYHYILFNYTPDDLKFYKKSKCEWSNEKNNLYTSRLLEKTWGKGFVVANEVNFETCAYVARYVGKKWKNQKERYNEQGKLEEFVQMSRKPGIGYNFFNENKEKFLNGEKFFQKTKKKVLEINPGRYYDKLLEKENEEELKNIKKERAKRAKKIMETILLNNNMNVDEYRENQEIINQRFDRLIRKLK